MAWSKSPEWLIDIFYDSLPGDERLDRRKMFGYPCAFVNGNMFTGLHQSNMVVRLPEADREELLRHEGAALFEPMEGRVMREYVALPQSVLEDREQLRGWTARAFDYAVSLPVKPKKPRKPKRPKNPGKAKQA
jgi:TfoX/Sxy family transcriptional regulator of competence genes